MSEGCNTLSCCAVIFQLYDTDGDGFVTSNDVLALLRKTAGKALSENQLQQVSPHDTSWWQPLLMAAASTCAQHAFMRGWSQGAVLCKGLMHISQASPHGFQPARVIGGCNPSTLLCR